MLAVLPLCPSDHATEYGIVPPKKRTVALPLVLPKQVGFTVAPVDTTSGEGSVTLTEMDVEQLC